MASLLPAPGISRVCGQWWALYCMALYGCPKCRRVIQHAGTPKYRTSPPIRHRAPATANCKILVKNSPTECFARVSALSKLRAQAAGGSGTAPRPPPPPKAQPDHYLYRTFIVIEVERSNITNKKNQRRRSSPVLRGACPSP